MGGLTPHLNGEKLSNILGKPTKTKLIHRSLRPKYGEHQVQLSTQDTKSNLLRMTLRLTRMSALPQRMDGGHQVQINTINTKTKTLHTNNKQRRTPSPTYYQEN